jgi:hypothetical protein
VAIRLAEEEVERLQQELDALRASTLALDERADELRDAIRKASQRLWEAREALTGAEGRAKSEAVRKVIKAIRLTFEPTENPGPGEPTSRLVKVVVEPLEGDAREFLGEIGDDGASVWQSGWTRRRR